MRSRIIGSMIAASIFIGGYAVIGGGGGGGSNWAGDFNCYGVQSLPSSCYSLGTCTTTVTTSSGLTSAITAASGGDVICLNGASTFAAGTISATPASTVTIQPAPGTTATLTANFSAANHWDVLGVTVGSEMDIFGSQNITVEHSTWVPGQRGVAVCNATTCNTSGGPADPHILLNYDDFTQQDGNVSEGRVTFWGNDEPSVAGSWQISHSLVAGEWATTSGNYHDCADGVETESTTGVTTTGTVYIGPGNEFTGISQGGSPYNMGPCLDNADSPHADPIAMQDNVYVKIFDNYFHGNGDGSGGIFTWGHNGTVVNNVFLTDIPYGCLGVRGSTDWLFSHNYIGSSCTLLIEDNPADSGTMTVRDNAFDGAGSYDCSSTGATCVPTYDLNSGVAGTGNITGTAALVSSPSSGYYHYQLDSTSPGYNAASDGKPMGICSTCG